MSRYAKTIVAVIAALIVILTRAQELIRDDGSLSPDDFFTIVIVALGAVAVFAVPNTRPAGEQYNPEVSEGER